MADPTPQGTIPPLVGEVNDGDLVVFRRFGAGAIYLASGGPPTPAGPVGPTGPSGPAGTFLARTSGFGPQRTAAYTNLISGLVSDGVWPKLDALWVLATLNTTNAALNLVSTNYSLTPHGSPAFVADQGYTGVDGSSTVYLDTGFNLVTAAGKYQQNSAHFSVWINTNLQSTSAGGCVMGMLPTGFHPQNQLYPWYSDGLAHTTINSAGDFTTPTSSSIGFWVVSRTTASVTDTYQNASNVGHDTSASGPYSTVVNYTILARNNGGTPAIDSGSANQVAAASLGAGLTSGDVTNLYHRLNTYMSLLPLGAG